MRQSERAGSSSPPNTNSTLERDRELVMERNQQLQRKLLMERLSARAPQQRSCIDLARNVRTSILDARQNLDHVERGILRQAMDQMQHCVRTNTRQGLAERLEILSCQLGLKFMEEGESLYISSDMFYLEIGAQKDGSVTDVKVHHKCNKQLVESKELFDALQAKDFADFTAQLEGLTQIYQLNAEPKVKTKAFVALQAMETDVESIYNAQQLESSKVEEMVRESKVGLVCKRRGGHPMKLPYFLSPYDMLEIEESDAGALTADMLAKQQIGNFVTLNLEASSANKLQIAPIVSVNEDAKKTLAYAPLNANNSMMLPATYVLRLNKPMPVCFTALCALGLALPSNTLDMSSENNGNSMETFDAGSNGSSLLDLSDSDDTPVDDIQTSLEAANNNIAIASTSSGIVSGSEEKNVLNVDNLMNLIVYAASEQKMRQSERGMFVRLPDQTHCIFFTDTSYLQGTLLKSVPFTEPSQVPAIIEFLKEQSIFYALISSCVRPSAKVNFDMENTTIMKVGAKSLKLIHITLQHPYDEGMVDVELELNGGKVTVRIYTYLQTFEELSAKLSKIVQGSLSIPVSMRALLNHWAKERAKQSQSSTSGQSLLVPSALV